MFYNIIRTIEKLLNIERDEIGQFIKECVYIVLVAVLVGFIVNIYHPRGYTFVSTGMLKIKKPVMVSSEEAKIKMDSGMAVFIDTRTPDEYKEEHIRGAISIPAVPESLAVAGLGNDGACRCVDVAHQSARANQVDRRLLRF